MSLIMEYILATRPWSFTAAIIPVLIVTAVTRSPLQSPLFLRAFVMAVAVQAGANCTNTYFDYLNGIDTKVGGERTLVEHKISINGLLLLSAVCYITGALAVAPLLIQDDSRQLLAIFVAGILLAFFYTANPVGLKYIALGDVTIFVCFGPLLMQCTSLLVSGTTRSDLYLYAVPVGLLTEAILHANNARDIQIDASAGAVTLATLLGPELSFAFFVALLAGSYISAIAIAYFYHWGCLAVLLTAPLSADLLRRYRENKMADLPEETAKTHLPFGLLLWLGILFSEHGVAKMLV